MGKFFSQFLSEKNHVKKLRCIIITQCTGLVEKDMKCNKIFINPNNAPKMYFS